MGFSRNENKNESSRTLELYAYIVCDRNELPLAQRAPAHEPTTNKDYTSVAVALLVLIGLVVGIIKTALHY